MEFSEKLIGLRRREGLSQERLADRLGVTRQSVSKWEGGAAMPELEKLIALSELFGVSVDYLIKEAVEEPKPPEIPAADSAAKLTEQMEAFSRMFRGYRWDSRTRIWGVPLVSVRFCRYSRLVPAGAAKGIIAIGNIAVGVVSLGLMSVGLISIGVICAGALALGCLAFGLAALGPVAVGLLAFGPVAIGLWYAGGVTALGGRIAVGIAALGNTAVGCDAMGDHVLLWGDGLTRGQVESFLLERHPRLWRPLLRLLASIGSHLR